MRLPPLRIAAWALLLSFALSICALLTNPEQARLALLSAPRPAKDDPAPEVDQILFAGRPESSTRPGIPLDEPRAPFDPESPFSDAASIGPTEPEFTDIETPPPALDFEPSVPASLAQADPGDTAESAPWYVPPHIPVQPSEPPRQDGWVIHEASRTISGRPRFEELPPPPEFADEIALTPHEVLPPAPHTIVVEDAAALEAVRQLTLLTERVQAIQGDLAQLQTSQSDVARSLAAMSFVRELPSPPAEMELRAWLLLVSSNESAPGGSLSALARSGEIGDVTLGPRDPSGMIHGWVRGDVQSLLDWLQIAGNGDTPIRRTLHLAAGSTAEIDLRGLLAEQIARANAPAGAFSSARGRLALRAAQPRTNVVEITFCPASLVALRGAASIHWTEASLPAGSLLLVSIPASKAAGSSSPEIMDLTPLEGARSPQRLEMILVLQAVPASASAPAPHAAHAPVSFALPEPLAAP